MQTNEYLMHWGIHGMKWGRRRFQNQDGSLTSEGKVRYGSGTSPEKGQNGRKSSKKTQAKIEKSKSEKMQEGRKRAAEERAKQKEYEEAKERAITKGKASDVMKFKGDLTHEQMQRVLTRLQDEENLAKYAARERTAAQMKIDRIRDQLGTIKDVTNSAVETGKAIKSAIDFAKKASGKDQDSQNKQLQKIVDHGTAEQVQKNAYKMNSKQVQTANQRLENISKISQKYEQEQKRAQKAAEEKVKQKDAQNRAKAANEEAKRKAEHDAMIKESARKAYQNLSDNDRQRLAEYAKRKRIKSMKNQQAIVKRITFN